MNECSGSSSSSSRSIEHSSTAKAAPSASPCFLAHLLEPATEYDRSGLTNVNPVGLTSPNPVGHTGIYLLRTRGLRAPSLPIPGVGLGGLAPHAESTVLGGLVPHTESTAFSGLEPLAESTVLGRLVPRTEHTALGGLPLASTAFHDFRTHEPRIRIDGLSASPGRLVARVSSSVATTEGCTARGSISLPLTLFSLRLLPFPSRTARAPQKPWLQPPPSHSRLLYPGVLHRRRSRPRPPVRLCPSPPSLALQPLRRRRCTDEQRLQRVMHSRCRLWIRARRGPSAIFQTRYSTPPRIPRPRPAPPAAATPALADLLVRTVSLPSDRDHAEPIWELLSYGSRLLLVTRRLHIQGRTLSAMLLNCGSLIPPCIIHMPIGRESSTLSRRATLWCVTSPSAGHRPCHPTSWHNTPGTSVLPSQTSRSWRVRVDNIQPTTTSSYSSVTRHCRQQGLTNPTPWGELLACEATSRFASTFPCSCALGSCKLATRRPLVTLAPCSRCAC